MYRYSSWICDWVHSWCMNLLPTACKLFNMALILLHSLNCPSAVWNWKILSFLQLFVRQLHSKPPLFLCSLTCVHMEVEQWLLPWQNWNPTKEHKMGEAWEPKLIQRARTGKPGNKARDYTAAISFKVNYPKKKPYPHCGKQFSVVNTHLINCGQCKNMNCPSINLGY